MIYIELITELRTDGFSRNTEQNTAKERSVCCGEEQGCVNYE